MGSGSEAGSYLRLIDFVYHSTLGLRVMKRKERHGMGRDALVAGTKEDVTECGTQDPRAWTAPRRAMSTTLPSDTPRRAPARFF